MLAMIDGTVPAERLREVERHLDQCVDCRVLLSRLAMVLGKSTGGFARAAGANGKAGPGGGAADPRTTTPVLPGVWPATPAVPDQSSEQTTVALGDTSRDSWPVRRPIREAAALTSGTMVDHYEVVRMIGQGGMGQVYLAHDTVLHRQVALKLIHPRFVAEPGMAEQLLHEARAMARFSHPNIIAVFGAGSFRDRPYLVLEYVDGDSLANVLQSRRLDTKEALRIALAISDALAEAHRHGILHRDLKPGNVMIGADGRVCVLDFGLAKGLADHGAGPAGSVSYDVASNSFATLGMGRIGTPRYMAPEQWRCELVGESADVWALGVTLCEVLAGSHPFAEHSLIKLMCEVADVSPVSVERLDRVVPAAHLRLIRRCLDKDPVNRPSAAQVGEQLRRFLAADGARRRRALRTPILVAVALLGATAAAMVMHVAVERPDRASERSVGADQPVVLISSDAATTTSEPDAAMPTHSAALHPPADQRPGAPRGVRRPKRRPAPKRRGKAAAAGRGTLIVQTHVAGQPMWGHVYVDGTLRGQSPLTLRDLAVGVHRLKILRPGFQPAESTVLIEANQVRRFRFELTGAKVRGSREAPGNSAEPGAT